MNAMVLETSLPTPDTVAVVLAARPAAAPAGGRKTSGDGTGDTFAQALTEAAKDQPAATVAGKDVVSRPGPDDRDAGGGKEAQSTRGPADAAETTDADRPDNSGAGDDGPNDHGRKAGEVDMTVAGPVPAGSLLTATAGAAWAGNAVFAQAPAGKDSPAETGEAGLPPAATGQEVGDRAMDPVAAKAPTAPAGGLVAELVEAGAPRPAAEENQVVAAEGRVVAAGSGTAGQAGSVEGTTTGDATPREGQTGGTAPQSIPAVDTPSAQADRSANGLVTMVQAGAVTAKSAAPSGGTPGTENPTAQAVGPATGEWSSTTEKREAGPEVSGGSVMAQAKAWVASPAVRTAAAPATERGHSGEGKRGNSGAGESDAHTATDSSTGAHRASPPFAAATVPVAGSANAADATSVVMATINGTAGETGTGGANGANSAAGATGGVPGAGGADKAGATGARGAEMRDGSAGASHTGRLEAVGQANAHRETAGSATDQAVEQVVRSARLLGTQRISEMRIRLDPPGMGEITLRLRAGSGEVWASAVAAPETAQALRAGAGSLGKALEAHGLTLTSFKVTETQSQAFTATGGEGGFSRFGWEGASGQPSDRHPGRQTPEAYAPWSRTAVGVTGLRGPGFSSLAEWRRLNRVL